MLTPKSLYLKLKRLYSILSKSDEKLDEIKLNQGIILTKLNKNNTSINLKDYEFKIFSQYGDDGIIQHLLDVVEIKNKTFIEFGVEDFFESNCRFLLFKDNWSGFVIDGSDKNISRLKNSYFYSRYDLECLNAFITKDNINTLLAKSKFEQDLGILSIDIDGNDYYVLSAIDFYNPRILICEYNAVLGADKKISVPYDENFIRQNKHYSYLYFGASLGAICHAASNKGYTLVGTNSTGLNAFFVRNDLVNDKLKTMCAAEAFTNSKFRESRDIESRLNYIAADDRLKVLKGLPVLNVETGELELI